MPGALAMPLLPHANSSRRGGEGSLVISPGTGLGPQGRAVTSVGVSTQGRLGMGYPLAIGCLGGFAGTLSAGELGQLLAVSSCCRWGHPQL